VGTAPEVVAMRLRIDVVCEQDGHTEQSHKLIVLARDELAMEALGLSLAEGKQLLKALQSYMADQQVAEYLEQHRACPRCGNAFTHNGQGSRQINTLFGVISVPNPRWLSCDCDADAGKTFRPIASCLPQRSSPELQYLETKWASLIPYAKVVDLLKDVLPVSSTLNPESVRHHLHDTARKLEQGLGEELDGLFCGSEEEWAAQPLPDGPMTVGIDGGMVRARHKAGFFEVIAGKSIVAFKRDEPEDRPSAKRFGFVQTYDTKPRRRLWELMKSQGMQENQQVLFLSDGGDSVRNLQAYLHPSSEHVLDWFHVAMRVTVMKQQTKAIVAEDETFGADVEKALESVKHYLWHSNVESALERLEDLSFTLDINRRRSAPTAKLLRSVTEFDTYIRNNREFIPNFGERYRQGDTISTAFVESTINQVVSKRFVKKQQMQWTQEGAHLLLQTRTRVLDDDLDEVFRDWYPKFRLEPTSTSPCCH
jgi:hypothetical protein